MSNYVKLSSLDPNPLDYREGMSWSDVIEMQQEHWTEQLNQVAPDQPDLILLPEVCDRLAGLSIEQKKDFYRSGNGDIMRDFFANSAAQTGAYIAYSSIRALEDQTLRNSTQIIDKSGEIVGIYDKYHCTIPENEDGDILYGQEAPLFDLDFGKVACAICFDLNFHDLRLKYAKEKPNLILFSSMYHGGLMQNYWAYSCRSYFLSSIAPAGTQSQLISPTGVRVASTTNYYSFMVHTVNLDCGVFHIDYNNPRFTALKKKYGDQVQISDPGELGSVLISSESSERTIDDLTQEFELEPLDVYFERCRIHREKA